MPFQPYTSLHGSKRYNNTKKAKGDVRLHRCHTYKNLLTLIALRELKSAPQ